ncbi:MGH1-like glycoside hydrolase domain-containing protein [Hymenobacter pini]|uniref:MGH1-like glycoside hydrolase domain-containing protein n=1 Tax=Hymenobacter pini TaxID=2880879 RepID=UPI001CF4E379|nr:glucosidase [Hymenobacter pini]MCA8829489.1 glucosidase [Hymenobacter pini]
MTEEQQRQQQAQEGEAAWHRFGPYVSDRQWGTVREDYSADSQPWTYTTHDMARSYAYRWGEEGIGGVCDEHQFLCLAPAFWNGQDPILKERLFGLSGPEGNHGEDVKELYYYLDNTPTHSYMRMLYKYPQHAFPYDWLVQENARRSRQKPEFELLDTCVFKENRYFDIFLEYAKAGPEDLLLQITVHNRGPQEAPLHVLPQLWFRNTWAWGYTAQVPQLRVEAGGVICVDHGNLPALQLYYDEPDGQSADAVFCDNETNTQRLYGVPNATPYCKDSINDYVVQGQRTAVNPERQGTKAALHYQLTVPPGESRVVRVRLAAPGLAAPFTDFAAIVAQRKAEADAYYLALQTGIDSPDARLVQRQALAGMLWNKQFYYYDVAEWLRGDPALPTPPESRWHNRNHTWQHLNNADIISMPDKWEYPWYAAWDLAFHCIPLAMVDVDFAKNQLHLLCRDWYMHPNGQLPAYEWKLEDVNPPVHAWATWRVYKMDKKQRGQGDTVFLESIFHRLLLNFTWWVNRKDRNNRNVFEGGFLGLDNIGVFDRSAPLPTGGYIEQADGTAWMAMFALNMMRIALELARTNPVYQDLASKFFEHFLYIAQAMTNMADQKIDMWDDEDGFYYDVLNTPENGRFPLRIRSMVGLIPLFAVEVLDTDTLQDVPRFVHRLNWFLDHRPELAALVSRWQESGKGQTHLLSLLRGHRMKLLLRRMLDEAEFLSEYGVRALSRYHREHPFVFQQDGSVNAVVDYEPGESTTSLFGGNSNWRGPVWMPMNFLLIESLQRFYHYYGPEFKVEYPTGSGRYSTILEIAQALTQRLTGLFLRNEAGQRPCFGSDKQLQNDPHFRDYLLFHEYFHGDSGCGLGASHQTGWTGLIAKLLQPRHPDE